MVFQKKKKIINVKKLNAYQNSVLEYENFVNSDSKTYDKRKPKRREKFKGKTIEQQISLLSSLDKNFISDIKHELGSDKDYFFVWDINLGNVTQGAETEYIQVSQPSKDIYKNKILKSKQVYKRLSCKRPETVKEIRQIHSKIISLLKVKVIRDPSIIDK